MDKYIGKRLDGRYEIRELIGVGGMACVYKAYDAIDDRIVAVKILKDEFLTNEEFTRRFKNESKAIAILSHPNIVKVYDVSFGERIQYIVMEYIDGITLKEYIEQQRDIRWKEAVHFTVQILRALQHAHDKGIVHRDIKPQNIMLLPDGTIKVTDFGIARFARGDIRATSAADKAIGSVHYISPEQARGEITDEKADIYSVGVMLYEMLTGRLPFEADNAVSVAIMQMQTEPRRPREINPDIPEGLEEITLKAMQKDPAKRYQSAAEMLYDIDEFKRNPSIHFEYKYFIDETPTRFVEAISRVKGDGTEGDAPAEDEAAEGEDKKKAPMVPILAAVAGVVVLVALIFVGVVTALGIIGGPSTGDVLVPDLKGKMLDEVRNNPEYTDLFELKKTYEENRDDVPAGQIFDQDPPAGSKRKAHSTIKLSVSLGPKMVTIPDVSKNEDYTEVSKRLEAANLAVQKVTASSSDVKEGFVIRISPESGQQVAKGSTVQVFVSSGPEPVDDVEIPNVTQMTLDLAKQRLTEAGFFVSDANITYENHSSFNRGTVIRQDPDRGTMRQPGTEVRLVLASGFKNANINVPLPNTSTKIDYQVYMNGSLVPSLSKSNVIPKDNPMLNIVANLQMESYFLRVEISVAGKNDFNTYMVYSINGIDGSSTPTETYPFISGSMTSTPTGSAVTTTNPIQDGGHGGNGQ